MSISPFELFFKLLAKYGLTLVLIYFVGLLAPDFSPKVAMMELDLSSENNLRTASNLLKQLFLVLCGFSYLYLFVTSKSALHYLSNQKNILGFMGLLIVVCFISSTWSSYPSLTIKRTCVQIFIFLVIFGSVFFAVKEGTFDKCVHYLVIIFTLAGLFSIVSGTGFNGPNLAAWLRSKNNFGAICFMTLFMIAASHFFRRSILNPQYGYHSLKKDKQLSILRSIPIFILMVLSISKTCIALCLLFYIALAVRKLPLKKIFILTALIITGVFILPVYFVDTFGDVINISNFISDDTLTGRGTIWSVLYSEFNKSKTFFFGMGYGTYFNTGVVPDALDVQYSFLQLLNSAHNGYLELALQFGIVITTGIITVFVIMSRRLKLKPSMIICWLIFIYNISESAFFRDEHPMWITFLFAIATSTAFQYFERVHQKNMENDTKLEPAQILQYR